MFASLVIYRTYLEDLALKSCEALSQDKNIYIFKVSIKFTFCIRPIYQFKNCWLLRNPSCHLYNKRHIF